MWNNEHLWYAAQRIDNDLLLIGYAVALIGVFCLFCVFGLGEMMSEAAREMKRNPLFTFFFLLGCFAVSRIAFTCPGTPPVVVQDGIKLTKCVQTSRLIDFEWETEDDRIGEDAVYLIQEYIDGKWQTVKETTGKKYRLEGFTIDRMRKYRIVTSVTEGEK